MKIKAIYTPDIRYEPMFVFELQQGEFVCTTDNEVQYDIEAIIEDDYWVIIGIGEGWDDGHCESYNNTKSKRDFMRKMGVL